MLLSPDTWVISDTHLGHERMNTNQLEGTIRPPKVEQLILDNWRDTVGPKDEVLHLGDAVWPSAWEEWKERFATLPGLRRMIVRGNHDVSIAKLSSTGWDVLPRKFDAEVAGCQVRFIHNPAQAGTLPDGFVVIHGHTHNRIFPHPAFVNACVECNNYRPQRLMDLLSRAEIQTNGHTRHP